ncbi:MAG: ABC transporter permease [Terracidiphilus sp.]
MRLFHTFFSRAIAQARSGLRAALHRDRLEAEMEAELAAHLENLTSDLIRAGRTPAEAAREARIALGAITTHKEGMRASLGLRWWDELWADLHFGVRMLRKSPGFTAIATVSLALAIGANTTIYSAARQVLYERLAVPHAADLRLLSWTGTQDHVVVQSIWGNYDPLPGGMRTSTAFSYPAYQQLRAQNRVLDDLIAFKVSGMNATVQDQARRVQTEMVSGNYFAVLGVRPQLGRAIQPSDDLVPGRSPVVVISDGLWERGFGRSPQVLGRVIKLNDTPVTIVGVTPRGFTGAQSTLQSPDIFLPLTMQPAVWPHTSKGASILANPQEWWVNVMGRIRPGVSDAAAQAALDVQLDAIVRGTMQVRAGEDVPRLVLRDGSRGLFRQGEIFARPIAVLLMLVGLVLLLACANIANLMLARGAQREREMSIRLALGAGRARILRQMLLESMLLAVLGGACGLFAGYLGRNVIPKMTENAWERSDFHVQFDWRVFGFTVGVTVLSGLLFGMAPALAAARAEVTHGLKESAQAITRRRKGIGGKALVGFQIALSTLLVIVAGLFLRTLGGLSGVNVGFRTDHLLLVEVNPPERRYPPGKDIALHQRLEQAIAAVPGVDSVAPALEAYVSDDTSKINFIPQEEHYNPEKVQAEYYNVVGNQFFKTLGIPIVAGRDFGDQDTQGSPKVGIINESLARDRFPGQNPVGKRFIVDRHDADQRSGTLAKDWIQIVGVCGDTRYANLRDDPPPQFILPYVQQSEIDGMTYEIRTHAQPAAIMPALRRVVQQVDPDLPLVNVRTQDQQIEADLREERLFVTLTSGFGVLALALACVGIYGIMAYSVANRTNEIGIRLALGAQPGQVRGMIVRESTWMAVAGIVAGVAASLVLTRLVKSMLYGIQPYDPFTLFAGVSLLLTVALAASWIPARRAASVQPMEALRHE